MIVTTDFLAGLFTNFRVIWEDSFLAASSANDYTRIASVIPSSTDTESYNWLGTVPKMAEWVDKRARNGLNSFTYSLKNKHYEATIEVDRDTLEDDKYNLIQPRITQLGMEAARYPMEQAITTLVNGGSNAGYDGVNFFATTHNEGNTGNQSNTNTGSGVDTLAHLRTDFITARTAMRRTKDDFSRPMNLRPDLVVIPPDIEDLWRQLINSTLIASNGVAMTNVLENAVDIMVDSYLSDVNDWFLMCTRQPIKPLIFQNRKNPEFVSVNNPSDSQVFDNRMFLYGVDSRFAVGYGLWQMVQRVTN